MFRFAAAIFLSAFLLFQVQPLVGKFVLPWFGGSPAVWTTCMLMFQVLLLAGYAYAHFANTRLSPRAQGLAHLALLIASTSLLPIAPDASWKPAGDDSPTWRLSALLAATVGGPYFVLSTTGPLLQSWFAGALPGRSPFRLYALSNAGSLLALLSYPLVVEPSFKLGTQAGLWSLGYVVFALVCGWSAVRRCKEAVPTRAPAACEASSSVARDGASRRAAVVAPTDRLMWVLSSSAASVMLLATTNQMCQEVAVTPLLWIVPLAIYLVSFILTFDAPRWYRRALFAPLLALSAAAAWYVLEHASNVPLYVQLAVYCLALFACSMTCHGELVRSRPESSQLTGFYLLIASGGALGGVFTALCAPYLFSGYWEYQLGLAACCVLFVVALVRDRRTPLPRANRLTIAMFAGCGCVVLCSALSRQVLARPGDQLAAVRNFYGVLRVIERPDENHGLRRAIVHGRIVHGLQCLDPARKRNATSYYGPQSGIAVALRSHPKANPAGGSEPQPMRVGVIGLGAGTLAVYGRSGDAYRFYEINPDVVRLAREHFTFLADAEARIDVVLGDARIMLEQEAADGRSRSFDVLAVDAFSGDAIPMHLLTRECFDLYRRHLAADGLLALHVSNDCVDLTPVVLGLAAEIGYEVREVHSPADPAAGINEAIWLIVTRNHEFLAASDRDGTARAVRSDRPPLVWTDDFGSLRQVLK